MADGPQVVTELKRQLTLLDATMINVGTIIASAIFIVPAEIALRLEATPAPAKCGRASSACRVLWRTARFSLGPTVWTCWHGDWNSNPTNRTAKTR